MTEPWIGRPQIRREDARLVLGQGAYLDDLEFADCLHLAFVRSQVPHASIRGLNLAAAQASPGVVQVITAADLPKSLLPLPLRATQLPDGFKVADVPMPILAAEKVRFVGEAVAAVLAETRSQAADAADLVWPELDALPSVGAPRAALDGGPPVQPAAPDNVLFSYRHASGDVSGELQRAARVIRADFSIPRLQASPIEPRGCVAKYSADDDLLTLWCSSQDPHRPRLQMAYVLGRPADRIRVVVPDVGGAFGSKGGLAPEYVVAALTAIQTGRPVKWVETRSEAFVASYQGRGMDADAELAVDATGRFKALRVRMIFDAGAYLLGHTAVVGSTSSSLATGPYDISAADVEVVGAATNKVPTGPYRGAGRPEATFVIERLADLAAAELGMDPVAIRKLNLVSPEALPYLAATGTEYDSGDYPGLFDRALELADYARARADLALDRSQGKLRGIGVAVAVESSGNGNWETAAAKLQPDGRVLLLPGSSDHGQGHATTFSQIAADALGLDTDDIEVHSGDSAEVPLGMGTFASRSVTVGGGAILLAIEELQRRCQIWAAHMLDIPEEQLRWDQGAIVGPAGERLLTLVEIARAAAEGPNADLPELRGDGRFTLPRLAFGSSASVATVEIDRETGFVRVERLVTVDDAGPIINPLLAEGQVIGSSIQGVAAAIFEEVSHDGNGQPLTEGFMSYAIPTMPDVDIEMITEFRPTRSPLSPLGTKGVAESGCIVVPAAIANAVFDALRELGVRHANPPYSPEKLWRLMGGPSI
ncbi:MAG: xanthine dehydrogenase family protein molybdopterin-binding subunit [Candidatus Dormibacteria bacterium]